jgi:hypothetical protein
MRFNSSPWNPDVHRIMYIFSNPSRHTLSILRSLPASLWKPWVFSSRDRSDVPWPPSRHGRWNRTNPFCDRLYIHVKSRDPSSSSPPELRLPSAMLGGILVPIGLFWFAWSCFPTVHCIVPITGSAAFGAGTLLTFSGIWTFLVDAYPAYAASTLVVNSFLRRAFARAFRCLLIKIVFLSPDSYG